MEKAHQDRLLYLGKSDGIHYSIVHQSLRSFFIRNLLLLDSTFIISSSFPIRDLSFL